MADEKAPLGFRQRIAKVTSVLTPLLVEIGAPLFVGFATLKYMRPWATKRIAEERTIEEGREVTVDEVSAQDAADRTKKYALATGAATSMGATVWLLNSVMGDIRHFRDHELLGIALERINPKINDWLGIPPSQKKADEALANQASDDQDKQTDTPAV